jgi:hypothetical protein
MIADYLIALFVIVGLARQMLHRAFRYLGRLISPFFGQSKPLL